MWQNVVVIMIVGLAVIWLGRKYRRSMRKEENPGLGCGSSCQGCPMASTSGGQCVGPPAAPDGPENNQVET
ncbi:MAG: FeoB-associated Cys-rich membrane protein [Deltaproteobacteria bacterium]|nr:FeoB-associated Cys-rich membrane protein [Deltaproteobacteria bacterium]MBW2086951.1 FeoB-associated Cys-rich membrane protein [Deltaproteobacteria bacterium]